MSTSHTNGSIQSTIFSHIPEIVHGYTTRSMGDMRKPLHAKALTDSLGFSGYRLITPKQTHGNTVLLVDDTEECSGQLSADGLMVTKRYADAHRILIGVRTADCMPILLSDKTGTTVAVIHAGWKGLYGSIITSAVSSFTRMGIRPEDIYVSIGPSIGPCCYVVSQSLITDFEKKFDKHVIISISHNNVWYLDLQKTAVSMFRALGVPGKQIDSESLCTSCHNDMFFSYRKDSKATFGEITGFIGFNFV